MKSSCSKPVLVRVTLALHVLDSDSSYEDSFGTLGLAILPTNDYHCVG